jgi:hypothetical protein
MRFKMPSFSAAAPDQFSKSDSWPAPATTACLLGRFFVAVVAAQTIAREQHRLVARAPSFFLFFPYICKFETFDRMDIRHFHTQFSTYMTLVICI